jgi:hypothetical protein
MKKKMFTLLTLALAGSWLAGTDTARAQERTPAWKKKRRRPTLSGRQHAIQRSYVPSMPMPNIKAQGGIVDAKTGKYIIYNDSGPVSGITSRNRKSPITERAKSTNSPNTRRTGGGRVGNGK